MSRTLRFTKMSGTGNYFILVDNRAGAIAEDRKAGLARALSARRVAVGADGLILLEKSDAADVRMRIFNADGSEAEMCGNGSRCLARFAVSAGAAGAAMTIETLAGPVRAEVEGSTVAVELTPPGEIASKGELSFAGQRREVWFADTGVPHAVVLVEDIEDADVRAWGRALRFHEAFRPRGANADFVQALAPGAIAVRTYERGVEDETLACGTGAAASALVAAHLNGWSSPVDVHVRSGEKLRVHFRGRGPRFDGASLAGAVAVTFRGEVDIDG